MHGGKLHLGKCATSLHFRIYVAIYGCTNSFFGSEAKVREKYSRLEERKNEAIHFFASIRNEIEMKPNERCETENYL
jgi:hypothetical protein